MNLNRKQLKLLESIFEQPTRANIKFGDIEKLLVAVGAVKIEGRGSRVAFVMSDGRKWEAHRPHPQKEARKYQVETLQDFLSMLGLKNE